jgi:hypothetical protein
MSGCRSSDGIRRGRRSGLFRFMAYRLMDMTWFIWGIREPEKEFKFHPTRKWRFDYCWPDLRVAVEIEGGIWTRGRHTRGAGALGDMEKYNEAARMGWRVFRFTPDQLKKGEVQTYMTPILKCPS